LQSLRPVRRVAELGSLGHFRVFSVFRGCWSCWRELLVIRFFEMSGSDSLIARRLRILGCEVTGAKRPVSRSFLRSLFCYEIIVA
jgi:hypothetical protein